MIKLKWRVAAFTLAMTVLLVSDPATLLSGQAAYAAEADSLTTTDMPEYLRDSIEWVWDNRILAEDSTSRSTKPIKDFL